MMMSKFALLLLTTLLSCSFAPGLAEEDADSSELKNNATSHEEEEEFVTSAAVIDAEPTTVRIDEPQIDAGGMVDNVEAELNSDGSMHIKPASSPVVNVVPVSGDVLPLAVMPEPVLEASAGTSAVPYHTSSPASSDESTQKQDEDSEKATTEVPAKLDDLELVKDSVSTTESNIAVGVGTTVSSGAATTDSGAILDEVKDAATNIGSDVDKIADLQPEPSSSAEAETSRPAVTVLEPSEPQFESEPFNPDEPKDFEPGPNSLAGLIRGPITKSPPVEKAAPTGLPLFSVLVAGIIIAYL